MINTIYVESEIKKTPRAKRIINKFANAKVIECSHYGEIFNRSRQDFRAQKKNPALILAKKRGTKLMPVPKDHAFEDSESFYFSHMLNCIYDCKYCFLQGMFRSAHYVIFINYEEFMEDIRESCVNSNDAPVWFFSGYDCDSLALEPVTQFAREFIPFFGTLANAYLELRTKSTQTRAMEKIEATDNCVTSFSINPQRVIEKYEKDTSSLESRLAAVIRLERLGWRVALRIDPILIIDDFVRVYSEFFEFLAKRLTGTQIHSISLGSFRAPADYYRRIVKMHPMEPLFAQRMSEDEGIVRYTENDREKIISWSSEQVKRKWPGVKIFHQEDDC